MFGFFNRMLNSYRRFMYGRYGSDKLNLALCILAIVLTMLSNIRPIWFVGLLSYIPLVLALFRMLSKDIYKRQNENIKFNRFLNNATGFFNRKKTHFEQAKTYKFFKCPTCKQKIRIPKGRGKVNVTCPKCNNKFTAKT